MIIFLCKLRGSRLAIKWPFIRYARISRSARIESKVDVLKLLKSTADDDRTTLSNEISSITFVSLFFHSGPPKSEMIESSSSFNEEKKVFQLSSMLLGF